MTESKEDGLTISVEREDLEDGSITYHLWDTTNGDYKWIVGLNDDKLAQGGKSKFYAERIALAVNALSASSPPVGGPGEVVRPEVDARELLETLNEWFGQRDRGEPTTNSEAVMFREVHGRLNLLDSFTTKKADALSASSPPVGGPGEVVVKPLEWVGSVPHVWNAYSAVGAHYQIVQHGGDIWWVRLNGTALALGKSYASLEAAKAAANADFERRIRSALAAPVPNGVPADAVGRAQKALDRAAATGPNATSQGALEYRLGK